jgi:hypothetical protein
MGCAWIDRGGEGMGESDIGTEDGTHVVLIDVKSWLTIVYTRLF